MSEITVGQNVKVRFNGHHYQGQVILLSARRFRVRFTTGSGKTRETWFRRDWFGITGVAGPPRRLLREPRRVRAPRARG